MDIAISIQYSIAVTDVVTSFKYLLTFISNWYWPDHECNFFFPLTFCDRDSCS